MIVAITLGIPGAILAEATLAFLGIGAQAPRASWGSLIDDGRDYIRGDPHLVFFPALAVAIALLSFTFLGDGLRDALDPKLKESSNLTVTDDQDRAPGGPALTELPEDITIATEEGRRLAEQLQDSRRHARKLLEVKNLSTHFFTADGTVHAVDDVSFELDYGETLGLVGESGCGKSVTALSLTRLIPNPPGRIVNGEIIFDGVNIMKLSNEEMRLLRGKRIGFIFQDPMTSLNPTLTVGYQIAESAKIHMGLSRKQADDRAAELLSKVGIPRARDRMSDYPHQFSGGMRQRVMIAIALACDPMLLLADEPTTALDVTIQAQILELIRVPVGGVRDGGDPDHSRPGHRGRHVQPGQRHVRRADRRNRPVDDIFDNPRMPYAWGLLDSLPRLDEQKGARLRTIEGMPPDLINPGPECRFAALPLRPRHLPRAGA